MFNIGKINNWIAQNFILISGFQFNLIAPKLFLILGAPLSFSLAVMINYNELFRL